MSFLGNITPPWRKEKKDEKRVEKKEAAAAPTGQGLAPARTQGSRSARGGFAILHPYVTEKTSLAQALRNTYAFKVERRATARAVKEEVERLFGVSVTKVNMANMPGKKIRLGVREGRVPGFRKAMVTLKEGDKIDTGV